MLHCALTPHHYRCLRVSLIYALLVRLGPESNERDRNLLLPSIIFCTELILQQRY